jgi:hypothetical protein
MKQKQKEECSLCRSIILRGTPPTDEPDLPYCIEVRCETHKAIWFALTGFLERAEEILTDFPLVDGGLCMRIEEGFEAYPITEDCILGCIQRGRIKNVPGE